MDMQNVTSHGHAECEVNGHAKCAEVTCSIECFDCLGLDALFLNPKEPKL